MCLCGWLASEPLFIFDLGASVGDVKWAPYSSTVLAALTTDGKVFVFDINVNKYKPICVQQVVPNKSVRLTRIAFNQKIPFISVGDDKLSVIYNMCLHPVFVCVPLLPPSNDLAFFCSTNISVVFSDLLVSIEEI